MPVAFTRADSLTLEFARLDLRATGTVPGVVILHAAGKNSVGVGLLESDTAGALRWRAPGSTVFGPRLPPQVDGAYLLEDGVDRNKYLRVQTYAAFRKTAISNPVYLEEIYGSNLAGTDITAAEASAGKTETFVLPVFNDSKVIITKIIAWLDPIAVDLELSDDPGGPWNTGTTEATGFAFGRVLPGNAKGLLVRRTIGAASPADPEILNLVHIAFDGL